MAYDLHIFRGANWWEGTNAPVTETELLSVSGVEKMGEISDVNPQSGVSIKMNANDMFSYNGAAIRLRKGMLTVAARNEDAVETIRPLAQALGAVIQGDEGEMY